MASGITSNGVDLDLIFDPIQGLPVANTGYITSAGVDIATLYYSATSPGAVIQTPTGLKVNGVDLNQIFAKAPLQSLDIGLSRLQLVSCQNIITLDATIVGNTTGYTFLWVQQSGTPVTFLEPVNQESTTFMQTTIKDDKLFTFYVNYGLPSQISKNILVTLVSQDPIFAPLTNGLVITGSSTSLLNKISLPNSPYAVVPSFNTIPVGYYAPATNNAGYSTFLTMPGVGFTAKGTAQFNNSYEAIMWTVPNNLLITGLLIKTVTNGIYSLGLNVAKNVNYTNVISGVGYQINTVIMQGNNKIIVTGPIGKAVYSGNATVDTWEALPVLGTVANLNLTKAITTRTLEELNNLDNFKLSTSAANLTLSSTYTTRTLEELAHVNDNFKLNFIVASTHITKSVTVPGIISIG